eukprot:9503633-Pyramimonas_sp.AAC.1
MAMQQPPAARAPRGDLRGVYNRKAAMLAWQPKGTICGGRLCTQFNVGLGAWLFRPLPCRTSARAPRSDLCAVHDGKVAMIAWNI